MNGLKCISPTKNAACTESMMQMSAIEKRLQASNINISFKSDDTTVFISILTPHAVLDEENVTKTGKKIAYSFFNYSTEIWFLKDCQSCL